MGVQLPSEFVFSDLEERWDSESLSSTTFSVEDASATVTYRVDLTSKPQTADSWIMNDIVVEILGCAYLEGTTLRRKTPIRHPLYPSLYAQRIVDIRGRGPISSDPIETGAFELQLLDKYPAWTRWYEVDVVVEFGLPTWDIKQDDEVLVDGDYQEWLRYVTPEVIGNVEVLNIAAGEFRYAEDPAAGSIIGSDGKRPSFNGESLAIMPKTEIKLHWRDVPVQYISPNNGYRFPIFDKVVGRVNSDSFLGFDPGTLLIQPTMCTRKKTALFLLTAEEQYDPQVLYDVTFTFTYFQPPRAASSPLANGHNLFPYRGNAASADGVKYLLATRDGTASGSKLFNSYPFADLFKYFLNATPP